MSMGDYEIHIGHDAWNSLWGEEESAAPFYEDEAELDKMITEELANARRKRRVARAPR